MGGPVCTEGGGVAPEGSNTDGEPPGEPANGCVVGGEPNVDGPALVGGEANVDGPALVGGPPNGGDAGGFTGTSGLEAPGATLPGCWATMVGN